MRALIFLHRWLGVAFCLLFAMWFASGIVMHFVPYPAFTVADRLVGLAPIDLASVKRGPAEVVTASRLDHVTRVQLVQRDDGPIYLIPAPPRTAALHASDLTEAGSVSAGLALTTAKDYAARRRWDASAASVAALQAYDQWTLPGEFDRYRPLYRVALNDAPGNDLYVSTITGEVVLSTAHYQRTWNYAGSVAHWLYLTALRSHPAAWGPVLWWLSLLATVGAALGSFVGISRIEVRASRLTSPYAGLQAWHHWLGLCCMVFVLTWIFSGWLSMDDGTLFSTGEPSGLEIAAVTGAPNWNALSRDEWRHLDPQTVEAEWFAFDDRIYRRERDAHGGQRLVVVAPPAAASSERTFLDSGEINAVALRLAPGCAPAFAVGSGDSYARAPTESDAPVFRLVCGGDWFDIDAANGVLLDKLDASRRTYRWLYGALHRLDFPVLTAHPALRTSLIVALCGFGFLFSLSGVVIAWRRLLSCFRAPTAATSLTP
jgi:PepSY-associated TM region